MSQFLRQIIDDAFQDKRVLILGEQGFIGSSLALRLAELGARVLLADAISQLVRGQDYVFHSAAQVCHLKILSDPFPDIDINIRGTAVVMESLRRHNPACKLIKLDSRGQYGSVVTLPAGEDTKAEPKGIYKISLLATEFIIQSYYRNHGIQCVLTRLTNIYGPRAQMKHNRFGLANWFVRLALDDQTIPIFGDGLIKRDFLYIDDCVEALLRLALEISGLRPALQHRPPPALQLPEAGPGHHRGGGLAAAALAWRRVCGARLTTTAPTIGGTGERPARLLCPSPVSVRIAPREHWHQGLGLCPRSARSTPGTGL